ncbi:MAG: dual specificity protein phosphatase family protein [bacterium]
MKNHILRLLVVFQMVSFISLYRFLYAESEGTSNKIFQAKHWAIPVEKAGLPNFFKVTDELYRGAQPTSEGIRELEKMGIKTVINLRSFHSDKDEIGTTDIKGEHLYVKAWHPEEKEVVKFLKIVTDKTKTPVFVHCQHGADRTGLMVAMYRIAALGWTKDEAIEEMTKGDFGFHEIWGNIVKFIKEADVEEIKKKTGIK